MLYGISVSEGIGIGRAYIVKDNESGAAVCNSADNVFSPSGSGFVSEKARFDYAVQIFLDNTQINADNFKENMISGTDEADILLSHTLIVKDEAFQKKIEELLKQGKSCEEAVFNVTDKYRQLFLQSDDEELMLRASDITDIGQRLITILANKDENVFLGMLQDTILIIRELLPSMISDIMRSRVKAVITERGGYNSHASILARAVGLPVISGVDYALAALKLSDGRNIIVDAYDGIILPADSEKTINTYMSKLNDKKAERKALEAFAGKAAMTKDGKRIKLYTNISGVADVKEALTANADGVGLFRTEHIFMSQSSIPDETMQYKQYCTVAKAFFDRPVVIRTLDVGGDKKIAYLQGDTEDNPFLGFRAIRLCLDNTELFKMQLEAIIKAHKQYRNIRILLPFITCVDEIKSTKKLIEEIAGNDSDIKVGIMIETPAAVLLADKLAKYVDFLSIGTNDLSQYIMAADRGNDKVSRLCSYYQPAVIRAIDITVKAAACADCEAELCGEAATDSAFIPVLIGMGLTSFSVSSTSLLKVRKAISECDADSATAITKHVLALETEEEVFAYLH